MTTLRDFRFLLTKHPGKSFQIRLPDGASVPEAFHITEVGRVQKNFIDCGGTVRSQETCLLQVWLGGDDDHRLATGKLAGIMDKAGSLLPNLDVPLEVEYEYGIISQYHVTSVDVQDGAVILQLAHKHTDCLAKEACGIPEKNGSSCGCGPGCC